MRAGDEARYWAKVDVRGPDDCWPWTAGKNTKGYGVFNVEDPMSPIGMTARGAHRYAWERVNGPIPPGLFVDHRCFNRTCQNVRHMRLLTRSESSLRENKVPITHCKRGHEFTPENTKPHAVTGARVCIQCQRDHAREWARKHRSAARFPRISDDTKAEVVRLRASGLSYAAIAKQLGISQTSAWKAAH